MKAAGYFLLVTGFIAGAYFASTDTTETDWMRFVPAIVAAIAGVVLLRRDARASALAGDKLQGNREILFTSIDNIVANLEKLRSSKESIPPYEMRYEVDRSFRDDLANFAEARESMVHLFGLQKYADIMSEFAAGERYLNRVWSASADGYVDEVLRYVDKAHEQFRHARDTLHAAAN